MSVIRNVIRTDRSPLNAQRWCQTLDCGHETWVTQKTKPRAKTELCEECEVDPPVASSPTSVEEE